MFMLQVGSWIEILYLLAHYVSDISRYVNGF